MADFLRNPRVLEADIIAIQEPWENPYTETTHHPAKATHELVYPTSNECSGERTRVCMLISKRVGQWTHHAHGRDVHELRIKQQGEQGELRIFNIYNPVGCIDTIMKLEDLFGRNIRSSIVLGDFNLHHPAWGGEDAVQDANADALIELTDSADLDLWLAPGTITRDESGHQTTIDLVFGSHDLSERFLVSEIARECHAHSDHLPIRTILDISTTSTTDSQPKRRNWKAMETEKFDKFVAANLRGKTWSLATPRQIDEAVEHFIDIINRAVEESTPWARPSQYANPSFTGECREAVKETRRLFRRYIATHSEEDWEVYKLARNQKGRIIKRALRSGFREFVKEAINQGPQGLWRMSKWARNRGQEQSSIMPPLKTADGIAESTNEKVQALREAFFPTPPDADLSDITNSTKSPIPFPPITKQELTDAIRRAPPNKAPGADGIPNKVWRLLAGESASQRVFISTLLDIFNACLRIGHNPRHFQTSITVTLRKAGPRDYRLPKAYRPVALLNTLGKVLEAIIATRIAWAVEEYRLLPDTHLGGRKGVSVDHAIQLILDRVHTAWGSGKKASMLLLDVAGAYDNVSHERLLHNMRQMGLSELVPWTKAFLTGRSTRIRLPGHLSDEFPTNTGIPQGSPISPILFLLFNTPLVKNCSLTTGYGRTEAFGWVDDVCILAISDSYEENVWLIEKALGRADQWAKRHAARFAPDKFELIHYSNPRIAMEPSPQTISPSPPSEYDVWAVPDDPCGHEQMPVAVPGGAPIQASEQAKYLGIWLDKQLNFSTHRKKLLAKANGSLEALRGISGSTWGASLMCMRKLYQAVIVPQALWGISAWYCPAARSLPAWEMTRLVNELTKLQKRAAILISGAVKSISTAALDIELFLLPTKLRLQQSIEECAIRILTGPQWACPRSAKMARKPKERRIGGWAPLEALVWKKGPLKTDCAEKWESRVAFVLPPWEKRVSCFIEPSEAALATHDSIIQQKRTQEGGASLIYTDGSGFEGHIGAAAVNFHDGDTVISDRRHLGTESQSTVYAAELSGIEMALARAIKDNKETTPIKAREVIIFSDSQAAIQAVQNPQRPSGQYALTLIYAHVRTLRSQFLANITLRWIPAHVGVPGNEAADGNAKCAALESAGGATSGGTGADQPTIRLAAAAKRMVRERIQDRWKKQWESERTAQPTKRLVEWPSKKTLRLYNCLSKPRSSIMIQMRSMRIALRHFLYKINEVESDKCPCGEGSQTPRHVLLQCQTYGELRKRLFDQLHRAIGPSELSNYDSIVSNPLATRYVAKFMHQTGLLAQFQHTGQEETDDEAEDLNLEVMGQSPEDAGHSPMLANTDEGGENLDELFEYTLPDWAIGPGTA
ncbi:hypothetical protein N7485_003632 [Penicillium canescens]|nr:hypothetical protein N7485_003632 [Penicillium canescens]